MVTTAKPSVTNVGDAASGLAILNAKVTANGKYTVKFASGAFVKGILSRAEETKPFELHYTVDCALGISNGRATDDATVVYRTNAAGQRIQSPQKGINIMKMSDGKTVKVIK